MMKTVLVVALVVVFCVTWWLVAGEAWQEFNQPFYLWGGEGIRDHFRIMAIWGIFAGLLVDALLLFILSILFN